MRRYLGHIIVAIILIVAVTGSIALDVWLSHKPRPSWCEPDWARYTRGCELWMWSP